MTASLCPLDYAARVKGMPGPEHVHDPCSCLDDHAWPWYPAADPVCSRCGAKRCGAVRGQQRCTRRAGHGKRHAYAQ